MFAVTTTIAAIQTKHKDEIISLCKIIEKSLLLKDSPLATFLLDLNTFIKVFTPNNALPKSTKR